MEIKKLLQLLLDKALNGKLEEKVKFDIMPMSMIEDALEFRGWESLNGLDSNGWQSDYSRIYYNSEQDKYLLISSCGYYGNSSIEPLSESEALDNLSESEDFDIEYLSSLKKDKSKEFIDKATKIKEKIEENERKMEQLNTELMEHIQNVEEMIKNINARGKEEK